VTAAPPSRRALVGVTLVALVVAGAVVGARYLSMSLPVAGHPYVRLYDPPRDRAEAYLVVGDGQAFAALAQDPTLARPTVFRATANDAPDSAEAAYRAQRPLLGWLAWAASGGQPGVVPAAMLALTIGSAALLAVVAARLAGDLGRRVEAAPLVLLAPGAMVVLGWTGVELLAAGLGLAGAASWLAGRRGLAVALLAAAALSRETLLVVPAALAAADLLGPCALRRSWRRVTPLAVAPLAWAGWVLVVHARLGSWPGDAGAARIGLPFGSVLEAASHWGPVDVVVLAVTVGLGVVGWRRLDRAWRWIIGAHGVLATTLGVEVLQTWVGFSRVLLPVTVLGIVALLPRAPADRGASIREPVTAGVVAAR
jgi:hypothetical protein